MNEIKLKRKIKKVHSDNGRPGNIEKKNKRIILIKKNI